MDSQFAKRFEREAHFMAALQHENILHVVDFVKDGRSMYIIMEYVEGIDLYDLLDASPILPHEVASIIAIQVCRASTTRTSAASSIATSSPRTS